MHKREHCWHRCARLCLSTCTTTIVSHCCKAKHQSQRYILLLYVCLFVLAYFFVGLYFVVFRTYWHASAVSVFFEICGKIFFSDLAKHIVSRLAYSQDTFAISLNLAVIFAFSAKSRLVTGLLLTVLFTLVFLVFFVGPQNKGSKSHYFAQ